MQNHVRKISSEAAGIFMPSNESPKKAPQFLTSSLKKESKKPRDFGQRRVRICKQIDAIQRRGLVPKKMIIEAHSRRENFLA
jgi:hypothetical protein